MRGQHQVQILLGVNTVGKAVIKQGWIQTLLCCVQHRLDAQDTDTYVSHLLRIADKLMERVPPNGSRTINHVQKE